MFSSPLSTLTVSSTATLPSAAVEADLRRASRETYVEPLCRKGSTFTKQEMEDFKAFMQDFYKTIYKRREECNGLCEEFPDSIGRYYKELVSDKKEISYEDFWQRYFYRCDLSQINKEYNRGKTVVKSSTPSPPSSNGLENQIVKTMNESILDVTKLIKNAVDVVQEEFSKADIEVSKMAESLKDVNSAEKLTSKKKESSNSTTSEENGKAKSNKNKGKKDLEVPFSKGRDVTPNRRGNVHRGSNSSIDDSKNSSNDISLFDPAMFNPSNSIKKTAATSEAHLRRGRKTTYLEPLRNDNKSYSEQELNDINEFLIDFHQTIDARMQELSVIQHKYPRTVARFYEDLVRNGAVSSEEFWQRYFYRCDPERIVLEWNRNQEFQRENLNQSVRKSLNEAKQLFRSAIFGPLSPEKSTYVNNNTNNTDLVEYEGDEPSV